MNFLLRLFCFLSLIFSDECKHIGQCDLYGVYIIRAAFAVVAKGSISVMPGVTFCSAISLLRRGAVVLALGFRFASSHPRSLKAVRRPHRLSFALKCLL